MQCLYISEVDTGKIISSSRYTHLFRDLNNAQAVLIARSPFDIRISDPN